MTAALQQLTCTSGKIFTLGKIGTQPSSMFALKLQCNMAPIAVEIYKEGRLSIKREEGILQSFIQFKTSHS
jgi:hypothetical protein